MYSSSGIISNTLPVMEKCNAEADLGKIMLLYLQGVAHLELENLWHFWNAAM